MTRQVDWLAEVLDYRFTDSALLEQALTHRSAGAPNNERLEFLGDAILNFVIANLIWHAHPDASEGDLSRLRASLVKGTRLAELATTIALGEQVRLGSGERKSGGFRRQSILADALEALLGAIYIDGGYEQARRCIAKLFSESLDSLPPPDQLKDPKTRLQELLQARGLPLPLYSVEEVAGAAHQQIFTVVCEVPALSLREFGEAGSRRRAEQRAARKVLGHLGHDGA